MFRLNMKNKFRKSLEMGVVKDRVVTGDGGKEGEVEVEEGKEEKDAEERKRRLDEFISNQKKLTDEEYQIKWTNSPHNLK